MKRIILIIFIIQVNIAFGQDYNKLAEGAAQDLKIPKKEFEKFKEKYIANLKSEYNKETLVSKVSEITDICDDGGFEVKDFSNWGWTIIDNRHDGDANSSTGFTFNSTITGTALATGRLITKPISTDGATMSDGSIRHANSKWEIVSSGSDPLISSLHKTHTGNYALKLGDKTNFSDISDYPWKSAETIQKTVSITATNKILKFWYAVVTNDASTLSNHANGNAAGFGVRVNGTFFPINPVPAGSSNSPILAYNNSGLTNITVDGRAISYLPWTCSSVDLSQFVGQNVTIEFMVFDCIHTGHFAYAYLDDICMGCDTYSPPAPCCQNTLSFGSAASVPPSYPYQDGTYAVEYYNVTAPSNAPITELKVQVISFEWIAKSGSEDCKQCQINQSNLGSLFGGIKIGGTYYGPSTGYSNGNNNEVVFSFPNGRNLTSGDLFRLTYVLPADKNLSCCQTQAKICRKITWKDINCNYCEIYDCSTVDLKNVIKAPPSTYPRVPTLLELYLNTRATVPAGMLHADGY